MKLYAGKLIKSQISGQIDDRQELRDAIVWAVDQVNRYATVKIQGSNQQVRAYYPENWESTPSYLKPGNSVRISHPGGSRGRIEIMGHGILLPSSVTGGSVEPTPIVPEDIVLSGGDLSPTNPTSMGVLVTPGSIRIGGIVYFITGLVMDRPDIVMDRIDLLMDNIGDSVTLDSPDSGQFRYDSIVVGTDSECEVVKGDNFTAAVAEEDIPDPPVAPADHVLLGWVLLYPNMTVITQADINRKFTYPTPCELRVTVADDDLAWGELSTTISLAMYDQYGNLISHGGIGYHIEFTWQYGNGTLSYGGVSLDETSPFSFYMISSAVVTYTRDGVDPGDISPNLLIAEESSGLSNAATIFLRDALGNLMA